MWENSHAEKGSRNLDLFSMKKDANNGGCDKKCLK